VSCLYSEIIYKLSAMRISAQTDTIVVLALFGVNGVLGGVSGVGSVAKGAFRCALKSSTVVVRKLAGS